MYKLLLATDRPEILSAFSSIDSWESMGFRSPRIVSSAQAAIDCLKAHHLDGVAFALPAQDESALMACLSTDYPLLPIFEAARTPEAVTAAVLELRTLLNRTHADFSNDNFGEADMLQLCRHEFFRALLGGEVRSPESVRSHLRLLRSRMNPDKPCVVLDLALTEGDDYLMGRWHYGNERLEVALRNFFGVELDGMRMLVSVLPDEQIRLLACPMHGSESQEEGESLTGEVTSHAMEAMASVREYLDLDLHIANIRVLPALTALAMDA